MFKKIASFTIGLLSLCFIAIAIVQVSSDELAEHTIENAQEIDKMFNTVAQKIEEFRIENKRLPSKEEFRNKISRSFNVQSPSRNVRYYTSNFPDESLDKFETTPTENSFLLSYWRGEWMEYYSSWEERNTLTLKKSDLYILGNVYRDFALFLTLSFMLMAVAIYIKP